MSDTKHPTLFSEVRIDSLTLANRAAVAPMTRTSAAEEGIVTDQMVTYYQRYARGGFGLVITEGTFTDTAYSQGYYRQPGIATDAQAAAWRPVVEGVHEAGAAIVVQLMHAGAQRQYNGYCEGSVAPSAVAPYGNTKPMYHGDGDVFAVPEALSETQLIEVIDGFVASAKRAMAAGFDGVEIHAANGYLLDEFLTDYHNQRTDDYGGSMGNRLRMVRKVLTSVRDAVGGDFTVGIRLSQIKINDTEYRWADADEAATIFRTVAEAGASYIHVTGAGAVEPAFSGDPRSLTELASEYSKVAVITNGALHEATAAEEQLVKHGATVVAVGRGALMDADWPARVRADKPLHAFDFDLLQPLATLDSQANWEAAHDDVFEPLAQRNG